jgi:transposase-like protein
MGPALAVTPFQVGGWTEEQAHAAFVEYRFARNGGEPYCEDCQCTAVYKFKKRPIFKCKLCSRQFSATSGTPWAYKKLPYRTLMYLVACFNHTAQALSARDLCRNLGLHHKTVMVWMHKLRAEIALAAGQQMLSGEVELDGCHVGGYVRRKNTEKQRKNQQTIHYRHRDSAMVVVAARQRSNGPIRTWIAKSEGDTRPFVAAALAPGTTLFHDEAPEWGWFRGKFRVYPINHTKEYYTPSSCTNQAENVFSALRVMARTHRHIVQNYLDLYAAEVAWRIGRNKQPGHASLAGLMELMSRRGKSELRGYFQGKKRDCPVVQFDEDNNVSRTVGWRPPARKPPRRQPADRGHVPFIPRWLKADRVWDRGFTFLNVADVITNPSQVPQSAGVYAIFFRGGAKFLEASRFTNDDEKFSWSHEDYEHAYTGETYALRNRFVQHFVGGVSNLRETLLALHWDRGALLGGPIIGEDREEVERALTDWLAVNAVVGFRNCGYVKDAEAVILNATASPLNIDGRRQTPFAKTLSAVRQRFRAEVVSKWPKVEYQGHRPRR